MTKARDIANSTATLNVDGGTIKLDGNYPVGTGNVALGDAALDSNVSGASNTAIGADALTANTASNNTAVGYQALYSNSGTYGTDNVAVGHQALYSNTSGRNVGVGYQALYSHTGTLFDINGLNTAVGYQALFSESMGITSSAFGYRALYSQNGTLDNTAVGAEAAQNLTTASSCTIVGSAAGSAITTGSSNTFLGRSSGSTVTTGSKNTILGRYNGNQGGLDIRTSSNNIVLSDGDGNPKVFVHPDGTLQVGTFGSWGSSVKLALASDCSTGVMAEFNNLNTASSDNIIRFRRNGTEAGKIVVTTSNTTQYLTSSDYRLKENVVELTGATDRLKQIPVHRFNFTADPNITVDGFLAHEVQAIVPEAIHGTKDEVDADGNPVYQGIDQSKLVPLLVATIKELEARITALESA